ncbi:MAG TPA: VOC family protein [Xanthobacteraceae bacterium]|jgi:catechol 2,3-dioxygenase-like lactoylglutathione lyase family enzyme|nr:VOC family protein [Xanthobacteraceae bacterium]
MPRVVGIDHLVLRVSDLKRSRAFYAYVLEFLGFKLLDEYEDMVGWTNGKTRLWINRADAEGKRHPYRFGNIGFHHYAFELESRADVDALERHLKKKNITIVDPAAEYYDGYYAVFFLDPDGMKLEGMKYGDVKTRAAKGRKSPRNKSPRKKPARKG